MYRSIRGSLSGMAFVLANCLLFVACTGDEDRQAFDPRGHYEPEKAEEIHDDIQSLRYIKNIKDPDAEVKFYKAQSALIAHGSQAQPQLVEALNGDPDWGVRLGSIHVLDAVGTRDCVESLIGALQDDHPLVAQKAMFSLRVFCDHRIVPEVADEQAPVPPIPTLKDGESPKRQELIWTRWYTANGVALHDAWRTWYRDNRGKVAAQ